MMANTISPATETCEHLHNSIFSFDTMQKGIIIYNRLSVIFYYLVLFQIYTLNEITNRVVTNMEVRHIN